MKNVAVFRKRFFKDEVKEKSYYQKTCVSLLPLRQKKFSPRHIHGFFFFFAHPRYSLGAGLLSQDYDSK